MSDVCAGCEHSLTSHFECVTGQVRCLVVDSGVSTSGVIGIAYSNACDCTDYESQNGEARRAHALAEKREHEEFGRRIAAQIRAKHPEMVAQLASDLATGKCHPMHLEAETPPDAPPQ